MHEEEIIEYLKAEKGLNEDDVSDFLATYRTLSDSERSRFIYDIVGKELYKEYPADIKTFVHDPYFLGNIYSDIIYPIWEEALYDIYPAPFCKKYNEAILSCATRCFAKGTRVRMYDGTVKNIEDIKEGQQVMGPDGKPRNVLSLAQGREEMFKITPRKGEPFICNKNHILALKHCLSGATKEISVVDFLELPENEQGNWRLYHSGLIDYPEKELPVDPYTIGTWIGGYTEPEVIEKHEQFLEMNTINGIRRVPRKYKTASSKDRKALLAGLIDSFLPERVKDPRNDKFRCLKLKKIEHVNDISEIARSLGISASYKKIEKDYYLYLAGEMRDLPIRIISNVMRRAPEKNYLLTTFTVESQGEGDYYGFTVDGDHLFLLEDYMVVRNSGKTTVIVISALYEIYLLLCMISPSKTLNVKNSANLTFAFLSKDNPTACSQIGEDVHKGLTLSPYFLDTITNNLSFSNLDKKGVQITNNILLKAGSTINVLTGTDLIFGCLDEANMPSPKIAAEQLVDVRTKMYRTMVDRRNATFSKAPALTGMIWLTSSPMDEGDVIGERIAEVMEHDIQNVYIMDNIPRWVARNEMKEDTFDFFLGSNTQDPCIVEESDVELSELEPDRVIQVPRTTEYLNYFRTKPRLAIQEVAGRRTVAENSFFNSVSIFKEVFNKENHIFKQDDLRLDLNSLMDVSDWLYDKDYFKHPDRPDCYRYIHLDMAEKKDRFGLASVYCDMVKYTSDEGEEIRVRKYFVDFCIGVSSSKGEAVDLLKILEFVYSLKKKGYPVKKVSTDSHQGELARQILRRNGVATEYQSVETSKEAYFFLKNLILTKTLSGYANPILTRELAGLRETNKRVEKGKGYTDDLCDALAGACFLASQDPSFKDNNEAISEMLNSGMNIATQSPDWKLQRTLPDIDFNKFGDINYLESLKIVNPNIFRQP